MPVLESTEFTTPRSALRFRPIGGDEAQPDGHAAKVPPPLVPRASRSRATDAQVEIDEWERAPGNAPSNTQAQASTSRSNATTKSKTPSKTLPQKPTGTRRLPGPKRAIKNHAHPLFYLGMQVQS